MKLIKEKAYYLLLEGGSNTVILAGKDLVGFKHLSNIVPDMKFIEIKESRFFQKMFLEKLSNSSEVYLYKWNEKLKKFFSSDVLSDFKTKKYNLIRYKYIFLKQILDRVESSRLYKKSNLFLQNEVESIERLEAEVFALKGYPSEEINSYPFVLQYAKVNDLTFEKASKMIIELNKINQNYLVNSQYLLLKYLKLLSEAKTYEEIRHIYKEFLEESGYKLA